jgi:hypothetical protein
LLVKFGRKEFKEFKEYEESMKRNRIQELGGALHDGRPLELLVLLVLLPTV